MAGYQIIADVSRCLLLRVREAVCPELLSHPEQVSLNAPNKKDNEAQLGVCLYGIRDYCGFQPEGAGSCFEDGGCEAPKAISLLYVAYFSDHSQTPPDVMTQQRALGRIIQLLHTQPSMDIAAIHGEADQGDHPASISFQKLDEHHKQEIWNGFSEPVRPAVYFEVGPLLIRGDKRGLSRVRSVQGEVTRR